ncbi:hypothetical protein [Bacillus fonticola]|nr:hypothetical protein [Bacillus fonticola]
MKRIENVLARCSFYKEWKILLRKRCQILVPLLLWILDKRMIYNKVGV